MSLSVKDASSTTKTIKSTTSSGAEVVHYNLDAEPRLRIARSQMAGYSVVHNYAENLAVNTSEVDMWSVGGSVCTYPAAAATVAVVSGSANDTSAGTGARTLTLVGLTSAYAVSSETITMNGTTPVNSVTSYIRVLSCDVATAGSGGTNAGAITVSSGGNSQTSIVAGYGRALQTHYTVPATYTAYIEKFYGSSVVADSMEVSLYVRPFGGVFKLYHRIGAYQNSIEKSLDYDLVVTEKSDIVVRAKRLSGSGAVTVHGGYTLTQVLTSIT